MTLGMQRGQSTGRKFIALALCGLFAASGPLLSSHLLEESSELVLRPVSPVEACQPGDGYGLISDHALQVKPAHVCVVCKTFSVALHVGSGPTAPLFSPSSGLAYSRSKKLHFGGFTQLSRSPPTRS